MGLTLWKFMKRVLTSVEVEVDDKDVDDAIFYACRSQQGLYRYLSDKLIVDDIFQSGDNYIITVNLYEYLEANKKVFKKAFQTIGLNIPSSEIADEGVNIICDIINGEYSNETESRLIEALKESL